MQLLSTALLLLAWCSTCTAKLGNTSDRRVSFWYAPGSYGGGDINNTLALLEVHKDAVTNVFVYCGHAVDETGLSYDPKVGALCLNTGLLTGIAALGMSPEIIIDSGRSDITDFRAFWANETANIAVLASEVARFGAKGLQFDFEPQMGSPASTPADATLYATFLSHLRPALAKTGVRLTICVASWSPMLSQYAVLVPSVDRLLTMETYSANSMDGWLNGDNYGGDYLEYIAATGPVKGGVGVAGWNQTCAGLPCWVNTAESGAERMAKMEQDSIQEVAVFRIVQQEGAPTMPQDWWWPLLSKFLAPAKNYAA